MANNYSFRAVLSDDNLQLSHESFQPLDTQVAQQGNCSRRGH